MCYICPRKFRSIKSVTCPACSGTKVQINREGLKVLCPACGGAGKIASPNPIPYPDLPRPKPHTLQVIIYGSGRPDDVTDIPTKWESKNSG